MVCDIKINGTEYRKYAYLHCVSLDNNNNKFYECFLNQDGSIDAYYGREGKTRVNHHYARGEKDFDKLIDSKLREAHPYKDITFTKVEISKDAPVPGMDKAETVKSTGDEKVDRFLDFLKESREKTIRNTYKTGFKASSVTKKLVDDLKSYIEDLKYYMDKGDERCFNKTLEDIFTIAPRQTLYSVGTYMKGSSHLMTMEKAYEKEYDLYETLYNQYEANKLEQEKNKANAGKTLPELMGVNIRAVTYKEEDEINRALKFGQDMSHCYITAIRVDNPKTAEEYSKTRERRGIKDKDCKLLFHGSNNGNWLSLVKNGMILNADRLGIAARGTGKGLGNGIYYADDIEKSLGYVFDSYASSYGKDDGIKCIGLYEVAVGKIYESSYYDSSLCHSSMERKKCDTAFLDGKKYKANSHSGHSGRNEYCVYDVGQTNIKYILMCQKEKVRQEDMHFSVRLDLPYKDMRLDGNRLMADAILSEKAKSELSKLPGADSCKNAMGIYDMDKKQFIFMVNGKEMKLTPAEQDKLFHDFKKSYFLSDKDFDDYVKDPEKDGRLVEKDKDDLER